MCKSGKRNIARLLNPIERKAMRLFKSMFAIAALAVMAFAASVHADESFNGFTCANNLNGNRVCTAVLSSGTQVVAGPVRLMNGDGNLSIYRRSSATNAASGVNVALGANTTISASVIGSVSASIVASRTDVLTGGQGYAWAAITPGTGATETTTVQFIERKVVTSRFE